MQFACLAVSSFKHLDLALNEPLIAWSKKWARLLEQGGLDFFAKFEDCEQKVFKWYIFRKGWW